MAGGLVVGAGDVEGHAVVEDDPVPVARAQPLAGLAVDGLEVQAGVGAGLDAGPEVADEGAGAGQALRDLGRALQRRAAPGHQRQRLQRGDAVQRLWPVLEVGVAGVRRGVELDQVAREQRALAGQPDHGVALGVAAAELQQLHLEPAQPQRHAAGEGQRRPGQPRRHRVDVAEQPRKAADLAGLVLLAALDDQVARVLAGDDMLGAVGRGAEHAHRVVVGQHDVADRLVGDFADAADHVGGHRRRGLGVSHQHRVVADHDAGVGVALGGVGPGVFGDLLEADLLLGEVGLRGEGFAHGGGLLGVGMRVATSATPSHDVRPNARRPRPARPRAAG